MKRSVAIIGPTPQFVRWAIWHPCPLRSLDSERLADDTFRQLRGIREYSTGLIEDRVFEDICLHPEANLGHPREALGFAGHEVLNCYGDAALVGDCCRGCPANAAGQVRPGIWGGCFGWLAESTGFSIETTLRGANVKSESAKSSEAPIDLVSLIDQIIESNNLAQRADELFLTTSPRWYGLWEPSVLTQPQQQFLKSVFDYLLEDKTANDPNGDCGFVDVVQIRAALTSGIQHKMALHVDLVPPGNSDGQTWTLAAHCPRCRYAMQPIDIERKKCPACQRTGNPHGLRKSKVLGLRPYVNLMGVMGEDATTNFLKRFNDRQMS